jgi:hypothetical protein
LSIGIAGVSPFFAGVKPVEIGVNQNILFSLLLSGTFIRQICVRFSAAALLVAEGAMTACLCVAAHAERRVALVIGNGAYKNVPTLPNPAHDAKDVGDALKRIGFETITAIDVDKNGMDEAAIRFTRAARDADVAMFYYSGHVLQYNGINYLIPVDAKLADEADLRRMARVDDLVADLQQAKNLRILVLDSCRDNPFLAELRRSIGGSRGVAVQRGLAKIDNAQGMIVSYATQAGQTAEDGTGRNSPYTTAFLKNIETKDEIGTIFRRIAADVYRTTNNAQLPEISLSVIGEFYLHGKVEAAIGGAPGKERDMNLARTAKPGADSLLAYSGRWDPNCNSLPVTVTITRKPLNGTVSVLDAEQVLPASTPGSGNTGQCAGKTIKSKKIMYFSKPDFRGNDSVGYDSEGAGTILHTTIAITVQ